MTRNLNKLIASLLIASCAITVAYAQETTGEKAWYPRTVSGDAGTAVIYAPQIEAWENFEVISARAAFRVSANENPHSYFGALEFKARTDTDVGTREVLLHDMEIIDLSIEGLEEDSSEFGLIREAFVSMSRKVPLDLVLAYLPQEMSLDSVEGLNTQPPRIFTSTTPAILLYVDGDPILLPIEEL